MTVKLALRPTSDGYGATYGAAAIRQDVDGGPGYYRADFSDASHQVSVQWMVESDDDKDYLLAFKRQYFDRGLPFLVDLLVDSAGLEERTARCIPGSFRLSGVSGDILTYGATFEIDAIAADDDADADIIATYA